MCVKERDRWREGEGEGRREEGNTLARVIDIHVMRKAFVELVFSPLGVI